MKMTDGEELILQSNSGILTLTSHRVRIAQRRRGETSLTSITLDAVESCGLFTRRRPILLYFAFFLGFVGVYNLMARTAPPTTIDAVILVIALLSAVSFAILRSDMLVIAARSGPVWISSIRSKPQNSDSSVRALPFVLGTSFLFLFSIRHAPSFRNEA